MCSGRFESEASINNTLTVLSTLTLGDGCGRLQDSTASSSPRRWQVPRVLSEMNAIISSFEADMAQLRDMGMNRLICFSSPDLKVVLHTESNMNATTAFPYLSGRVHLRDKQEHVCIYCILILYVGYTINSSRLTHFICVYMKCVIPRCSSSPHQLKQRYANAFRSPEYTLLQAITQTASYVFRWTKGIYLHASLELFLQKTDSGYFSALIYSRYLQFLKISCT